MAVQYNRNYKITISDKPTFRIGTSFDISGLRVKFTISKDLKERADLCKLEIYNLSKSTRGRIKEILQTVLVEVGYGDDIGVIFQGDIRNIFHRRVRTDIITEIYAGDGDRWSKYSVANTTTGAGKRLRSLLVELVNKFEDKDGNPIGIGEINIARGGEAVKGKTISGSTVSALNELAVSYDFDWFIEEGVFNALSLDRWFDARRTVKITSRTGMIESPIITEIGAEVKTLMNRNLKPGTRISIESTGKRINLGLLYFDNVSNTIGEGDYKILRAVHTGDTRGSEWFTGTESKRIVEET